MPTILASNLAPPDILAPPLPLPPRIRAMLLDVLAAGYPVGAPQTQLGNAPDGAIAWQVKSMLDDHSDRFAFHRAQLVMVA